MDSIYMINANLEQFLDTGWYNEATLYLNGYTYWCEGCWNEEREKPMHFFVHKYESVVVDKIYTKPKNSNYQTVFDIYGNSEEEVKEEFLKAKIFDGKSFWEVEKELAWYDET